jgi:hypothetical protein
MAVARIGCERCAADPHFIPLSVERLKGDSTFAEGYNTDYSKTAYNKHLRFVF